jgi:8-oxo-dGTP diphosphatase
MNTIKVDLYKAGGIIIKDRKVLVERSYGKQYFVHPGGKLEGNETARQALVRELREEFQIRVNESDLEIFGTFTAEAANHPGKIVKINQFFVKKWQGEIQPASEVEEIRWINSNIPPDMKLGSIFKTKAIPELKKMGLID